MTTQPELAAIPLIDVGASLALETAQQVAERAYDLLSLATVRVPSSLLRLLDLASRRWLERNASPYLSEITHLASPLAAARCLLHQRSRARMGRNDQGKTDLLPPGSVCQLAQWLRALS